jgi:ABC-type dipeptide/oligopeptide/nickel transport system ATPase subunit
VAPIVGRESEIAVVEAFLAGDDRGARALAIVGAPGIGKTTVWQAGVELARATGYRVSPVVPDR